MGDSLLATKLHVPRRRSGSVSRPGLVDRLVGALESAVVLVSAPAGFGKTTLLTDWLAALPAGRSVAWLSLDQRDNDPVLFWTYVVAALDRVVPGVGPAALPLLQSPGTPTESVLAAVVNTLDAVDDDVVLVLDDYHVVEAPEIQDGMAFLVAHLPSRLHLVIACRADPPLPLARWRARGELVEIRAADLRFTTDEAAAYLNGAMGLSLTPADVLALDARTEGWIAALQLAALSLQGRDDVAGFIAGFAGDDRYIVDYLVEEVLQRQPGHVRDFLLRTSVLNRLTGSLCDAVTAQGGGTVMLTALERGNLFLVPLDDRRQWYRYHHLFADVLRARLLDEQPDRVHDLHRRASDWYDRNGERHEAIHHALAGGDVDRAAELVELAIPVTQRGRQEATLRRWLEALPDEAIRVRPVLSTGYAGSLMVRGEIEGVEARLRDAERWLDRAADGAAPDPSRAAGMVVADTDAFGRLPAAIAVLRSGQARILDDVPATVAHAQRALRLADPEDWFTRGAAGALLGLAHWTTGDLESAHRWYAEGMTSLDRAGYRSDVVGGAVTVADIRVAQGRLRDAVAAYERGLRLAEQARPVLRGAADMHVGLGDLLRERNDLDGARRHLQASAELGEHAGLPKNRGRWLVAMARLRQADGDIGAALDLLDEAEHQYVGDFSPDVRPIPALRARVGLARGAVDDALAWARARGLSVDDDVSYLREYEHLTLARALVARSTTENTEDSLDGAMRLLVRLLRAADEGARTGSVIEILVVQALAHHARADLEGALAPLRRAMTLAEPEGYVRTFADEGPAMAALLDAAARGRSNGPSASAYLRRLRAAAAGTTGPAAGTTGPAPGPTHPAPVGQDLIDPLSRREREVLRLLATDLDGPDIARELIVSLSTVRTHTRNLYAKLGVSSRRAAVRRAADLGLLSHTPRR